MSGVRLGAQQLIRLRQELSERDLAIVDQVADLRLMSTLQIQAVHFGPTRHASDATATRTCRRVLERLVEDRLLLRLQRRIGGLRAGSAAYIYALSPVGQRVIELDGPRRRLREPSVFFVDHTLAIGQLVVELTMAANDLRFELLAIEPEPHCWRRFTSLSGPQVLRPDLFVALGVGDYEHRWFIEIDRGHESLPVVIRKCHHYDAYYQIGAEQAAHGAYPRVCWVVLDERRAGRLRRAIASARGLTERLFTVTTNEGAIAALSGATA